MRVGFYLIALGVFSLDCLTKWLIHSSIELLPIEIIPDYFRLAYVENSGVAFGLFQNIESVWKPYLLSAMAALAVVVIVIYSTRMSLNRTLLQVALAITLGGILGNFADRMIDGSVIDFLEFHLKDFFYWPTFNVADSAITVGIGLLLVDTAKNPEAEEPRKS